VYRLVLIRRRALLQKCITLGNGAGGQDRSMLRYSLRPATLSTGSQ
jgi:hypothetical protein